MKPRDLKSSALNLTPRRPPGRRAAFTLVELLVAAGITALMAGFIAVIVRNVSISWTRAGNRLGTDAQARIVLDQLQIDLQGALYRDDGNVWLAADVLNSQAGNSGVWTTAQRNPKPAALSLRLTSTNLADDRFGGAGAWLRFFTTSRGTNVANSPATISSPVAVGYQIVRRYTASNPQNIENTGYLLHRVETRPSQVGPRPGTLEAGFNIVAAAYTDRSDIPNNSGGTAGDPAAIHVVTRNARNLDSVIAENVIDFGIRCYVRDQSVQGGLKLIFPAVASGAGSTVVLRPGYSPPSSLLPTKLLASLPSTTPVTAGNYQQLMPDVVDVMVRILTDEGAALIANMERVQTPALTIPQKYNNNAQQWWWGVAEENSRVYTRRIVLNAKSL
jgi:hypothetical protein